MSRFRSFSAIGIWAILAVSVLTPLAGADILTPSEYYSFDDYGSPHSPFAGGTYQYFHLEDFEDGVLNTPGVSANSGYGNPAPGDKFRDSVDWDGDHIIDGLGRAGGNYLTDGSYGLEFTFDPAVLGSWPTVAGLVWTDVGPSGKTYCYDTVTFEAFDTGGTSLGSVDLEVGDGNGEGGTAEDRFFGVTHAAGISRITLTSHFTDDWTMDHLQYGSLPKPGGDYHLTASSTTGGSVTTPGEGDFTYTQGTGVLVVATADPHYHFVNWTGTAVTAGKVADPTSASTTVTMYGDYTLVANFAIDQQILSTSSGDGGTVTTPGEGSFTYDYGTSVPVVATPYHFLNWTGTAVTAGKVANPTSASTTVMVDGDYTLVANFAQGQFSLMVSSTKGGKVLQPGLGTFHYDYGTVVSLEAIPDPGYLWAGWSGSLTSPLAMDSLTMTADLEVQANFTSLRCELYVDDNAPTDPAPGDNTVSDPYENGSPDHPFDSIQEAIDVAGECARVIVREGTYWERIDFLDKAIIVTGFDPSGPQPGSYPIIDGAGVGPVVKMVACCPVTDDPNSTLNCEKDGPQPVLMGFVITGGNGYYASAVACRSRSPLISNCVIVGNRSRMGYSGAIYCENSAPRLVQCTISGNVAGGEGGAICGIGSKPMLINSIVWDNVPGQMAFRGKCKPEVRYVDIQGGWPGTGNLGVDPLFVLPGYWADPANLLEPIDPRVRTAVWIPGDYHLMSMTGRWDFGRGMWVQDMTTSPCVDAGNPLSPVLEEPVPNGNRVNMGAYGGTSQASTSLEP